MSEIEQAIRDYFDMPFRIVKEPRKIPTDENAYAGDIQECPYWLTDWIEQVYEVVVRFEGQDWDEVVHIALPHKEPVVVKRPFWSSSTL